MVVTTDFIYIILLLSHAFDLLDVKMAWVTVYSAGTSIHNTKMIKLYNFKIGVLPTYHLIKRDRSLIMFPISYQKHDFLKHPSLDPIISIASAHLHVFQ